MKKPIKVKKIEAWGIINQDGELDWSANRPEIYSSAQMAKKMLPLKDLRIVPITLTYKIPHVK